MAVVPAEMLLGELGIGYLTWMEWNNLHIAGILFAILIVVGFEQASTGGVILDGKEVTSPGLDRMVVFQSFALMPWLPAFDNVRRAMRAAHPTWDKTSTAAETQRYLDMMGFKGVAPTRWRHLTRRRQRGLEKSVAITRLTIIQRRNVP